MGTKSQTINKLLAVPSYEGVMTPHCRVIPLWQVGVDEVCLTTFLEGARRYYKRNKSQGVLYIPLVVPFVYYSSLSKVVKNIVKEIEKKYDIHCIPQNRTVDDVIESHYIINAQK